MKDCWWCVLLIVLSIAILAVSIGYLIGTYLTLNDLLLSWD